MLALCCDDDRTSEVPAFQLRLSVVHRLGCRAAGNPLLALSGISALARRSAGKIWVDKIKSQGVLAKNVRHPKRA